MIPQWRFYSGSKVTIGADELRMEYLFDKKPYEKPSLQTRTVSRLTITSIDDQKIEMDLLDAEVTNMGNGTTFVYGKNFDIFADGVTKN
jgi:hypothetical protein